MSSRPEIAPGAPATAAAGPACHSEEALSPRPRVLWPLLTKVFAARSELVGFASDGWLGKRGGGAGTRGGGPEGWAQRAAAPRDRAVLLPLQGLGLGGGGSWSPGSARLLPAF